MFKLGRVSSSRSNWCGPRFLPPSATCPTYGPHGVSSIDCGAVHELAPHFLKSDGVPMRKGIPPPIEFHCSNCGARYEIVRLKAPLEPTTGPEITCLTCGAPLHGREGKFVLKYFLIEGSRRRA